MCWMALCLLNHRCEWWRPVSRDGLTGKYLAGKFLNPFSWVQVPVLSITLQYSKVVIYYALLLSLWTFLVIVYILTNTVLWHSKMTCATVCWNAETFWWQQRHSHPPSSTHKKNILASKWVYLVVQHKNGQCFVICWLLLCCFTHLEFNSPRSV